MNGLLINSVSYSQELKSNVESGNGYIDLVVLSASNDSVVILELKKTDNPFDDRKKIAREAVQQIIDTGYAEAYMDNETICSVYAYGLCFCKKTCSISFSLVDNTLPTAVMRAVATIISMNDLASTAV